jgi:hypothetical protein
MSTKHPNTRRNILILVVSICILYGILFVVSRWLTNAGKGDLALILFIAGGFAVLGLAAHLFRDVLKPRTQEKPIAERDSFMAALAGKTEEETPESTETSPTSEDDE